MAESTIEPGASAAGRRKRELAVFLFLAVVLMPVLAVGVVGSYGLAVWMYQLVAGPPSAP
jgi:periplasmic nitrate reductase NapE